MDHPAAHIDTSAVAALREERVDWRHKAIPPALWGRTVAEVLDEAPRLSQLPTPLLSLSRAAMTHNRDVLAAWCAERGVALAPHGKTTMAPQLWAEQLAAGSWAITVANLPQLAVARAFGVSRVIVANAIVSPLALRWISDQLTADPDLEVFVWADSPRTVALMHDALAAHAAEVGARRPLAVLVERGGAGGRTGARDEETGIAVAEAVAASPHLELAGVTGYEGALSHSSDEAALSVVHAYVDSLLSLHRRVAHLVPEGRTPVVSAGGSAYFEQVADALAPLVASDEARVVLRSGAYITHDDGFYRGISPLGSAPRTTGPSLRSALHGWVRISSQPEPGLALFDAGKRDLPFDEGMPEAQLVRARHTGDPATPITGVAVTALNDQHGFLRWDPEADTDAAAPVEIGDELRLGLSHPCTAFDKWGLIPVLDDADAADPIVVDLVRTWF
ncbi:amino acid deaminase [Nocardioides luteus]|uniref:Amino acid deaminase n=2 Tax=Nocardioides luteus TaxID=1844 RepID=A0ABQ5SZ91_9ACTN|nr:amino acid deaminase [Nocardioides luteus]GLJ69294.1 amino acid deaminase [Nocardioides luteus]